ncbi:Uncharacterized protein M6B38_225065 [Iris pallida]|uniref:Uncharacterized protein n=1 Tax=Iris pallida TaxID=29817 RepID=A0AAX6DUU6_IRIPA|nr:Uncharacterized protein M6B38_225065 [Iris pallida]
MKFIVPYLENKHFSKLWAFKTQMQESVLSSRRSPPSPRSAAASAAPSAGESEDESKRRKLPSSASFRLSSHHWRLLLPNPVVSLLLLLLVLLLLVLFLGPTGNSVCFPAGGSFSRVKLLGGPVDGFASEFGFLGVPWCRSKHGKTVEWTYADLLKGLEEFVPIYETRPIKNNMNGMGFDHSFGLWFMARWLKPDIMIESGAFKGHSTWVLRQAMPETPIISITPRHPEKYLKKGPAYVDHNCTYFSGKDFLDFGNINWNSVLKKHGISDISRVLVFFDDHQSELRRLTQALKAGFKHLIFEDNYDTGTGDHYSMRQICDQFYIRGGGHSCFKDGDEARLRSDRKKFWEKAVDIDELCGKGEAWWGVRGQVRDNFNHSSKAISYEEHFHNSRFVESVLDVYWELPPVAGPSLTHQTRYDPARTSDPIIEEGHFATFQKLGLTRLQSSVFNGYTQMVYLQVSDPAS